MSVHKTNKGIQKAARCALVFMLVFSWIFSGFAYITYDDITKTLGVKRMLSIKAVYADSLADSTCTGANVADTGADWTGDVDINDGCDGSNNERVSATVTGLGATDYYRASGFDFSTIPAGSTLVGIEVTVERHTTVSGANSMRDNSIILVKANASDGTEDKSAAASWNVDIDASVTFGTPTDKWDASGDTWTIGDGDPVTDITDADFGVKVKGSGVSGSGSKTVTGRIDAITITIYYTVPEIKPSLIQHGYKWFANTDSTAVGGAAGANSPTIAPAQGTPFRLRMLLYNEGQDSIGVSGTTTDLMIALRDSDGVCDGNESYSEVSPSSGVIRYHNNATPADGNDLTASSFDPRATSSVVTVRNQDYEESNTFTNSVAAIGQNEAGLWDFALIDVGAPPDTTYCFRAEQDEAGTNFVLSGYDQFPEITTAKPVTIRLRGAIVLRTVRLR